jgi:hypothetical protein
VIVMTSSSYVHSPGSLPDLSCQPVLPSIRSQTRFPALSLPDQPKHKLSSVDHTQDRIGDSDRVCKIQSRTPQADALSYRLAAGITAGVEKVCVPCLPAMQP